MIYDMHVARISKRATEQADKRTLALECKQNKKAWNLGSRDGPAISQVSRVALMIGSLGANREANGLLVSEPSWKVGWVDLLVDLDFGPGASCL